VDRCTFPPLSEPYRTALEEAAEHIFDHFEPVAIVVSGSIIRGNPDSGSDLDLYLIHQEPYRQRIQRFFNGVPAELFVNPLAQIPRYFAEDTARGRPLTAHLLATGHPLYDPEGVARDLQQRSAKVLAGGPNPSPARITQLRYAVATMFEDADDIRERDPDLCQAFLYNAAGDAIRLRYLLANAWQPRQKELLTGLRTLDPEFEVDIRAFYRSTDLSRQLDLARRIVQRTAGESGFFEWESDRQPLDP
jgi:hypothetical protein